MTTSEKDEPAVNTEPDTSRPGWKARTVFGIFCLCAAISFFVMGDGRALASGLVALGRAWYHVALAVKLRRSPSPSRPLACCGPRGVAAQPSGTP